MQISPAERKEAQAILDKLNEIKALWDKNTCHAPHESNIALARKHLDSQVIRFLKLYLDQNT